MVATWGELSAAVTYGSCVSTPSPPGSLAQRRADLGGDGGGRRGDPLGAGRHRCAAPAARGAPAVHLPDAGEDRDADRPAAFAAAPGRRDPREAAGNASSRAR